MCKKKESLLFSCYKTPFPHGISFSKDRYHKLEERKNVSCENLNLTRLFIPFLLCTAVFCTCSPRGKGKCYFFAFNGIIISIPNLLFMTLYTHMLVSNNNISRLQRRVEKEFDPERSLHSFCWVRRRCAGEWWNRQQREQCISPKPRE